MGVKDEEGKSPRAEDLHQVTNDDNEGGEDGQQQTVAAPITKDEPDGNSW